MSGSLSTTIGAIVGAFVLAAIAVWVMRLAVRRVLSALEIVNPENRAIVEARARPLSRALSILVYGIATVASVSLVLSRLSANETPWDPRPIIRVGFARGVNIVVIIVGAYIVTRAAHLAIAHLQYKLGHRHANADLEWQRRAATLGGILASLVSVTVAFVAVLMLLRELTIDVLPILTGAGIAGLAIGFGAQNLVRDVISGFFLILEDQVRVGDVVRINAAHGTVEQVNLRTIVLRDDEGAVQVFPNGSVTTLANLSKEFSFARVDVRIAYNENLIRVMGTIQEVGAAMQNDPAWGPLVLAPLETQGVESLADGVATIGVKFRTLPLNQGKVANELRRRLLVTFVARGIRPYAG